MRVTAILLAAGKGLRFESRVPKPLVKIGSEPVIVYSLRTLGRHPLISEIILVVNSGNSKAIAGKIKQYRIDKVSALVAGGRRRQDSVYRGLKAIKSAAELVLIHDAARPFVGKNEISLLIKEAQKNGAAILGVAVKQTIKEGSKKSIVKRTLERKNLWEIQTPQVFRRELILEAYKKFNRIDVTDDAMLVEKLRGRVSIVPGSYRNIKITTPEDLAVAKAILGC